MSRLARLLRAMDPRAIERNAARVDALRESTRSLRQELHAIHEGLTGLATQLGLVHRQMEQLVALRREDLDTPARMDGLERTLHADSLYAHVRTAVARSELVEHPAPHVLISGLLPADVYAAALDAIPSSIFFENAAVHAQELRVPPKLAPAYSIATWIFLTEMVTRALGPALVERFQGPLHRHIRTLERSIEPLSDVAFVVGPGRLVLRRPGLEAPSSRTRPWHLLTAIVALAQPDDGGDYGSVLFGPDSASRASTPIPFRANSVLVVFNPAGTHRYESIPHTAVGTARITYEFSIGPDNETRRRLVSGLDEEARRKWETWE